MNSDRSLVLTAWLVLSVSLLGCNARKLDLFERAEAVVDDDEPLPGRSPGSSAPDDGGPTPVQSSDDEEPKPAPVPVGDDDEPSDPPGSGPEPSAEPSPGPASGGAPNSPVPPAPEPAPVLPSPSNSESPDASVTPTPLPSVDAGAPDFISIDDFEDGDLQGSATSGWWYTTTDTTAGALVLETTVDDTRTESAYVLHLAGNDFTDWGVIVGLDLRGDTGSFDARPTTAVRFAARAAAERPFILRILEQDGGSFTTELLLTTEWIEFVVPFSTFGEALDAGSVDTSALGHLHFYFGVDPFEAWIDDVAFVSE